MKQNESQFYLIVRNPGKSHMNDTTLSDKEGVLAYRQSFKNTEVTRMAEHFQVTKERSSCIGRHPGRSHKNGRTLSGKEGVLAEAVSQEKVT